MVNLDIGGPPLMRSKRRRRCSPTEEIGWSRTQEIRRYPTEEIGRVRSEEILKHEFSDEIGIGVSLINRPHALAVLPNLDGPGMVGCSDSGVERVCLRVGLSKEIGDRAHDCLPCVGGRIAILTRERH